MGIHHINWCVINVMQLLKTKFMIPSFNMDYLLPHKCARICNMYNQFLMCTLCQERHVG